MDYGETAMLIRQTLRKRSVCVQGSLADMHALEVYWHYR